mgnify:CR=1 FL=1
MDPLIGIMFVVVVCIGIGLLILISLTRRGGSSLDQDKYRSNWLQITQKKGDSPDSWQLAVLNADKLLDSALRERGVKGDSMGQRLKNSSGYLSKIDAVWRAHKLRNRIAHEHDMQITKRQTEDALNIFRDALRDLGAL